MTTNNHAAKKHHRLTESEVRQVCQLLQDHPDWPYRKIAEMTGVPTMKVCYISKRDHWISISCEYNLDRHDGRLRGENHPNNVYTTKQIEHICDLLDTGRFSYEEISKLAGVPSHVVRDVFIGKSWLSVSKNHAFMNVQGVR